MTSRVGEPQGGSFAAAQLAASRKDPRSSRDERGVVADFWDYVQEADRVRSFAISGIQEMREALQRQEQRLGVRHDDPDLSDEQVAELQAAWERTEVAKAESLNQHPMLNGLTLIGLCGALDGYVEALVPAVRILMVMETVRQSDPAVLADVPTEVVDAVQLAALRLMTDKQRKSQHPKGVGAIRLETVLAKVGLGAPPHRPLPVDLRQALAEVMALRNVLVHRAGRVDEKAKKDAPSLRYREGDFVRIDRKHYRMYSAAIRAYGAEVTRRVLGEEHFPLDLAQWRSQVYLLVLQSHSR